MTLLKQLVLVIVTLFVMLFAGTFVINVSNTREYLNNQLQTISQDTASSLGLSISPHVLAHDMITVESMVNAVFDSGYYREVVVRDLAGKAVVQRRNEVKIEGVPGWFVGLFPLDTPVGEALVMAGWNQAGTVSVASNPGYAYATLWSSSVEAFWWFLGSSLAVFGLGMVALHFVLRPLREVEAQAKAICDREFPVQTRLPFTLELRSVVQAMNRMTTKVKEMFDEQARAIERLRAENYQDATTGLHNRRYFDMQLRHLTEAGEDFASGGLFIVEIQDFKGYNERYGYQAADRLLQGLGRLLKEQLDGAPGSERFIARLTGASFGLVLANVTLEDVRGFGADLATALSGLQQQHLAESGTAAHIGAAYYRGQTIGQLLGEADTALRIAQSQGVNTFQLHEVGDTAEPASASDWRKLLQDILAGQRISLAFQKIVRAEDGAAWGGEILLRGQREDGSQLSAGEMLPMARRFAMTQEFDRLVLARVFARLRDDAGGAGQLTINIFPASIRHPGFVDWVCDQLGALGAALAGRCVFELAESAAVEDLDSLRSWIKRLNLTGARSSLDHFGKGFASYDYLSTLKLDYLKIDGSYVRGIEANKENQHFVDSVVQIAHGLDISVQAESVENAADLAVLRSLGVEAVQGYGVARPEAWS